MATLRHRCELRIRDRREDNPKLVIGFSTLLAYIGTTMPECMRGHWEILGAEHGHGEFVCSIEDRLDSEVSVTIPCEQLLAGLLREGDYFEDVRMRRTDGSVELGRHDSTFVFVRADRATVEEIASGFQQTEIRAWER